MTLHSSRADARTDLVHGTLDMLILRTLMWGPHHGLSVSLAAWLKRQRTDDEDFQEEIRAHLKLAADEKIADGADRRNAQLASLKDFGNVSLTTEAARNVWTPRWLDAVRDQLS